MDAEPGFYEPLPKIIVGLFYIDLQFNYISLILYASDSITHTLVYIDFNTPILCLVDCVQCVCDTKTTRNTIEFLAIPFNFVSREH